MTTAIGFGLPDLPDNATADDVAGILLSIPGLRWDRQALADILASPPDVAKRDLLVLAASSEKPGADVMGMVVKVLETVVVVAGGIAGITGAIAGVQSVKW